jgi:hypothetical protein
VISFGVTNVTFYNLNQPIRAKRTLCWAAVIFAMHVTAYAVLPRLGATRILKNVLKTRARRSQTKKTKNPGEIYALEVAVG